MLRIVRRKSVTQFCSAPSNQFGFFAFAMERPDATLPARMQTAVQALGEHGAPSGLYTLDGSTPEWFGPSEPQARVGQRRSPRPAHFDAAQPRVDGEEGEYGEHQRARQRKEVQEKRGNVQGECAEACGQRHVSRTRARRRKGSMSRRVHTQVALRRPAQMLCLW